MKIKNDQLTQKEKDPECGSTLSGGQTAPTTAPVANSPQVQIGFTSVHPNGSLQFDGKRASLSINWTLSGVQGNTSGYIVQHVVHTSSFDNGDGT